MKVEVLQWVEMDLKDITDTKIAEELHKELDRQLDMYGIRGNKIVIDVNAVINDLIQEEFDKKNIQFANYKIID